MSSYQESAASSVFKELRANPIIDHHGIFIRFTSSAERHLHLEEAKESILGIAACLVK